MRPPLSIAIPTHQMENRDYFFKKCLDSLWVQTFQDFEIIVSDNSEDDTIENICKFYFIGIKYHRNPLKGMAPNTNVAIRLSSGELIKILYMDDHLAHNKVLEMMMKKFSGEWLIAGANNNHNPRWTDDIHTGNNKLGSPSALMVKNEEPLLFDESLTWLLDCDLYKRYYEKHGKPVIMRGEYIMIGEGLHQMTYQISEERKKAEHGYLTKKYG